MTILYLSFGGIECEKNLEKKENEKIGNRKKREFPDDCGNRVKKHEIKKEKKKRKG